MKVVANTLKLVIVKSYKIFFIMSMFTFNKFCLVRNFGTPQAKKWGEIKELMQSAQVDNICKALAALDPKAADYQ